MFYRSTRHEMNDDTRIPGSLFVHGGLDPTLDITAPCTELSRTPKNQPNQSKPIDYCQAYHDVPIPSPSPSLIITSLKSCTLYHLFTNPKQLFELSKPILLQQQPRPNKTQTNFHQSLVTVNDTTTSILQHIIKQKWTLKAQNP